MLEIRHDGRTLRKISEIGGHELLAFQLSEHRTEV
jgi:hypothetical protein